MSYKKKPQIKLYKYENSAFVLQAIIDDYQECSFEDNRFQAGQFSITINYNIPNALLFEKKLWVQFGNNPYKFGEIKDIQDSIGEDGEGSQLRIITGLDSRYIFKRRIIKNLNNAENWSMTAKGELCMRKLIYDQCGAGAEEKRRLPITNIIPEAEDTIGNEYSVAESFSNLYEVLKTIATQSEIGWRLNFDGSDLTLEFYQGEDRHLTVKFDTDYESLSNGEFKDTLDSFTNAIFVGGKGTGNDRDIYEGESAIEGSSPAGLDRFEAWDNQSSMTTESEYEAEALSMLNQYSQTLQVSGKGLAKCPYEYEKEYNVGDIITIRFSGKSAIVQILSVTEHWAFGNYDLEFSFGKPQPDLNQQLQLILKQIQKASNKTNSTSSVKWYTIPTDTVQPSGDVVYDTIGFIGTVGTNATFTLYLDNEKTGAKTYHVYFKQLGGTGKLTLTTGKAGATNLVMNSGTYVAIIYVDINGNITMAGATATDTIASGNNQPLTSNAVATSNAMPVDTVASGNMHSVTSNAVNEALNTYCQFTRKRGSYNLTNSGYVLLCHAKSYGNDFNHDVSIAGRAFCGRPTGTFWYYFNACVRGRGASIGASSTRASMSILDGQSVQGNQYFTITYKVVGNVYHIYFYAKCIENYMRHYMFLDFASYGDVFPLSNLFDTNYIETPNTVYSSIPSDQTILYGS